MTWQYGRPNWDKIFQSIADKHPATEAGVFFCGPKVLGHTLHLQCNKSTDAREQGTQFVWGKVSDHVFTGVTVILTSLDRAGDPKENF